MKKIPKRIPGTRIMRERCMTCKFRATPLAENGCNYIFINKKRRGCSPENCTKYEKGRRIKLNEELEE